jgi:hypothetical protein
VPDSRRPYRTDLLSSTLLCGVLAVPGSGWAQAPATSTGGAAEPKLEPSQPVAAVCDHLPRVSEPAALPNDNREPAGTLRDGVLSLRLEARKVTWHPEGPNGCGLPVHAFAEEGEPARRRSCRSGCGSAEVRP